MFGYTAAEAIGHSISLLIPADVGVEGLDIPNRVRRGETIEHIEMEKLTKTGQRVPISLTVSPIVDAQGQVIGISRIAGDITERRRTEAARDAAMQRESEARAAAEAASRMKDEFLAVVSHELRTPLNAILGWAHMLRGGAVAADAVPKAIDTIERNARIQAQLVEDLLDVSRIISGKMALKMALVDLPSVVRAAIDAVRPAAAQKDIEVRRTMQQDIVVSGDAARLQQAVWNLLVNAIKFTPARGRVEVDVQRIDHRAVLTVRDTGVGIDPSALPFIFDRFRQADRGTTRAYGGLGLGLTIVDYVAQAHGGTVRAESAGPGRGATFELTLPLRAGAAAAAPARTAPERPDLAGRRVLVVDDDPDARDLARAILEPCGAAVETAASVGDALTAVRHAAPDLLIGDIAMPDQDGFDLIRLIRSAWPGRTIPALALTAYSGAQHRDATLAAGYDAHLGKPIDPDVLCAMVAQLTRQTPES
jgi:PAS domain S-box-containing protein